MLPGKRNSTGAIYVLQGPPPAGTPFVGGIAVSQDGAIYVSQAFTPPFSPANLFASGEQGAWYDPSDLSTMFQDSAGTIPVTADGQPVGLILDKSGNNNHASQATAAARPLYKTDGTYDWLQFDGVDDALVTASLIGIVAPPFVTFCGISCEVVSSNSAIWSNDRYISGINGSRLKFTTLGVQDYYLDAPLLQNSVKFVGTTEFDTLFDCTFRFDGANQTVVVGPSDSAGGQGPLYVGAHSGSQNIAGNIYSIIILGRQATPQEITDTETWVNGKTGAY